MIHRDRHALVPDRVLEAGAEGDHGVEVDLQNVLQVNPNREVDLPHLVTDRRRDPSPSLRRNMIGNLHGRRCLTYCFWRQLWILVYIIF